MTINKKKRLKERVSIERAVSYLRYSDVKQSEGTSIETQKEHTDAYIEENGMLHIADYIDEAKTASKNTNNRESFLRMLADAKTGAFDVVLIFKFSRVFRNQYEAHFYEHELAKSGVKLISVTEPIADTHEGQLMKGIIHAFNEFTSSTISAHVSASMNTLAKKGYFLGSVSLFGYDAVHDGKEGRRYQVNEEEAKIVRELFELFADGRSIGDIARLFSKRGYKTRQYKKRGGNPFGEKTLRDMLKNPHYIGIYQYKSKDYPDIVIPKNHDAIVEELVWLTVQARLQETEENHPKPRTNAKRTYYLTGKMVCGYCGANCTGSTGRWKYKGITHYRPYYHCNNRRQARGDCPAKTIRKDFIEAEVFAQIRKHILNEEAIARLSREIFALTGEEAHSYELEALEKEEAELMEQLSLAMDSTLNMKLTPSARKMWQKKTEAISEALELASNALRRARLSEDMKISIESIEEYLRGLLRASEMQEDSQEVKKMLVDKLVERIVVTNEDVDISLRVSLSGLSAYSETTGFPVVALRVRK